MTNAPAYFGALYMTEKKNYDICTWLRQNLVFILILIGTMCYYDKYMFSCHSATMVLPSSSQNKHSSLFLLLCT